MPFIETLESDLLDNFVPKTPKNSGRDLENSRGECINIASIIMKRRKLAFTTLYVQYLIILTNVSTVDSLCTCNFVSNGIGRSNAEFKHCQSTGNRNIRTFLSTNLKIKNIYSPQRLGIFNLLRDKLDNFLQGQWFVPPVPTGPKPSEIIAARGPLQTDQETFQLFLDLGLDEDADAEKVISAMNHQLSILPEDRHEELKNRVNELLRKKFVEFFKEFEKKMEQGPEIWRELWNPSKNDGDESDLLESLANENELSEQGKMFINAALRRKRINAFFYTLDLGGLIRFTDKRLFKQRQLKVQFLMIPALAMGVFERLAPTSMALQSMIASKIISDGLSQESPQKITSENDTQISPSFPADGVETGSLTTGQPIESITSARTQRSLSARSMMTSVVVLSTSLIGAAISNIAQGICKAYQLPYLNNIAPTVITACCVNTCLLLSSLLVDTSPMNTEQQRLHDLKKFEKFPFPKDFTDPNKNTDQIDEFDDQLIQ